MPNVSPVPAGYEGITPYLRVKECVRALEFYKQAFGAVELCRIESPPGTIGHAELKIGGGIIMLSDEFPQMGVVGPQTLGGTSAAFMFYVSDVDAVAKQAVAAGAKVLEPVKNQFYGDRSGKLEDPFGHTWVVATHVEDVSPEEMARRAKEIHG